MWEKPAICRPISRTDVTTSGASSSITSSARFELALLRGGELLGKRVIHELHVERAQLREIEELLREALRAAA